MTFASCSGDCCRTLGAAPAAALGYAMTVGTTVDTVRKITINQELNGLAMDPIIWEGRARLPDGVLPEPPENIRTGAATLFENFQEVDEEEGHEFALLAAAGNVHGKGLLIEDRTRHVRNYGRCGKGLRVAAICMAALAILVLSAYGVSTELRS